MPEKKKTYCSGCGNTNWETDPPSGRCRRCGQDTGTPYHGKLFCLGRGCAEAAFPQQEEMPTNIRLFYNNRSAWYKSPEGKKYHRDGETPVVPGGVSCKRALVSNNKYCPRCGRLLKANMGEGKKGGDFILEKA